MERLTRRSANGTGVYATPSGEPIKWENNRHNVLQKLADYEDLEEQGRLVKLPAKDDTTGHRECVHIKSTCYHENYKCSECPLTELLCDEFYLAIDRCYEDAYANGCLAGMDLAQFAAEKKLEELRGGEND